MKKKLLASLLTVAMLLTLLPVSALAIDTEPTQTWADAVQSQPEGYAEEGTTITISSAEGLAWFAKQINTWESQPSDSKVNFAGYTINIIDDINLSGKLWTPIDTSTVIADESHSGYTTDRAGTYNNKLLDGAVINGNNHTITGMTVHNTIRGPLAGHESEHGGGQSCYYYAGFIGRSSGTLTIQNLTFEDAVVDGKNEPSISSQGSSSLAVVLGYNGGTLTCENVNVTESSVTGYTKLGAFTGNDPGTLNLRNCSVTNSAFVLEEFYVGEDYGVPMFAAAVSGYKTQTYPVFNGVRVSGNSFDVPSGMGITVTTDSGETVIASPDDRYNDLTLFYREMVYMGAYGNDHADYNGTSRPVYGYDYGDVATVSSTGSAVYSTLAGAIAAAGNGDTVTLLKDASGTIPNLSGKTVTLDLNGSTLTIPGTTSTALSGGADLTICNGSILAPEMGRSPKDGTNCLFNILTDSSITLDTVQVDTTASVLFPQGDAAQVTVLNSDLKCGVYAVGTNAATVDNYNVVITLKDSKFTGTYGWKNDKDSCPVTINVPGTLNMTNCIVTGTRQGVLVRGGTASISDSTIVTTGEYTPGYYLDGDWGGGDEVPMAALVVGNRSSAYAYPASCTVTNTTITSRNVEGGVPAIYTYGMEDTANRAVSLTIAGDDTYVTGQVSNNGTAVLSITGGTFTAKPDDDYLGTGLIFTAEDETNGPWTVTPADGMSADATANGDTATAEVGGIFNGQEDEDPSNNVDTENTTIAIDVTTSDPTVTTTQVTIQGASLSSVQQTSGISNVEIATDVGTVTLTKQAWDTITDNAAEAVDGNDPAPVTLMISSIVEEGQVTGVKLTATANDQEVFSSDNSGNAAITVSVPVPSQLAGGTIQVYYMSPTGPELVDAQVSGGNLVWTVNHFSEYRFTSGSDAACLTKSNGDSVFYYSLQDAIDAAQVGDMVSLLKNVNLDGTGKGNTQGVLTIDNKDIILNGNGKTITASNITVDENGGSASMINVQGGADVTIRNLIIDGGDAAKHGLNVYRASAELEGVTIRNNRWYAVVVNGSELVVNGLATSGNQWGINVDNKSGDASLDITSASISEAASIVFETSDEDGDKPAASISGGSFKDIIFDSGADSAELVISGGTFLSNGTPGAINIRNYLAPGMIWDPESGTVFPSPSDPSVPSAGDDANDFFIDTGYSKYGKVTAYPGWAEAGDTVKLTVKPNSGYELSELSVTSSGKSVKLTAVGENQFTFTMPSGTVSVEATFTASNTPAPVIPSTGFVDVSASAWYYNAVNYVVDEGIMSGTGANTFEPNTTLTRAMVAQMLYAMSGKPNQGSNTFGDVDSSAWYADAVAWVSYKGVMTGYGEGRFAPNTPVTREQMALILYNYAKLQGYDTDASSSLSSFADGASVSSWAQQAMSWAVAQGLFSGRDGNMLTPAGTATRAEIAQIFMQFCKNVAE